MERTVSPRKVPKSPVVDSNINVKTSVTCVNVPEALFEAASAKKHFSKFGRVQKIRLYPKRQMCIVEYDQPVSVERAVLNAGAYDGFMFDVTRTKARVRRRSKREDDPDWVPDSDVEEELSAMRGAPTYHITRQKPMEMDSQVKLNPLKRVVKQNPVKTKMPIREKKPILVQPTSSIETPVVVPAAQSTLSTAEAAQELHQLRSRVSLTPDEQWRTLDARDRILRAWGGAGSRVKIGGATIGTCPDMCPEKELLHRQAEHQVMTLETVLDSDGLLDPRRAVKQYSRSSADQEIPMCYELRPSAVLMRTTVYLLNEIADTKRQVSLADWFHFMWDRFRGIRKDITQQALCCAESIQLVEMCARFHAHCSARLADLEHTQFDQKLNTDNLTKCLQTLKHMYTDVGPEKKPREAEFRGYIALLNLGDSNFWWEIKQLPLEIQKSDSITFAIKIFNALDNNNYVRFFRLVKEQANYLQACILLRYFNDVRARALARVVKAFAPRGGSRYPAEELMNSLAFESVDSMKSFINHYGLRLAKDESELTVILDRNQFIEDSDPYPIARAVNLIESKRQTSVGEVIAGGTLPSYNCTSHNPYTSFIEDGKLKESALTAEDQGYNTANDSNKDVQVLKSEIQRLSQGGRSFGNADRIDLQLKNNFFAKSEPKISSHVKPANLLTAAPKEAIGIKQFSFKPAIAVAPVEVIKFSPEKVPDTKNIFSFSKPQDSAGFNAFAKKDPSDLFKIGKNTTDSKLDSNPIVTVTNENKDPFPNSQSVFKKHEDITIFKKPDIGKSIFSQVANDTKNVDANKNVFARLGSNNIFAKKDDDSSTKKLIFGSNNIFASTKDETNTTDKPFENNVFAKTTTPIENNSILYKTPPSIFGQSNVVSDAKKIFGKSDTVDGLIKPIFTHNGETKLSPGSLFKSANNVDGKNYSIFQSKNKPTSVADNIFNSVNITKNDVYEFSQTENDDVEKQLQLQRENEDRIKKEMEQKIQEKLKQDEARKQELKRQEEIKKLEEERKRQEEIKVLEEKRRREEERKQEELKKKLEEERNAEIKRRAEEEERKFKEKVEKESIELTEELIDEVRDETVKKILKEEVEDMNQLISFANAFSDELLTDLCNEITQDEIKAEVFWTHKLLRKWFKIWRQQFVKNNKRRFLLEDTPVWLSDNTPLEEAACLRRPVETAALKNMNAIHRGFRFSGESKQLPTPQPYNVMEIIKSPLLKRMKQINYPYDKCFFWKVALVCSGEKQWLCKKIRIEKWLIDVFSDKKSHETSDCLIYVGKQSWNNLMDFAISISLINNENRNNGSEALEGANALLFYFTESDADPIKVIDETLRHKYPYQVIPVVILLPQMKDESMRIRLDQALTTLSSKNIISSFKICILDSQNISESLNTSTKSALKWAAKKYPQTPPLEIDYLKSICQRYLGNEIWYRLKLEQDSRIRIIMKDLNRLVKCYNIAVDKLTEVITNEELFNYPAFSLEFKKFLNHASPYPKPYEFIPTSARNSENVLAIKDIMQKLKLPYPVSAFQPLNVITMQEQIRKYCNQIGWFEDPEKVVCKVVALLPNQFSDLEMPCNQFKDYFEHFDLLGFLNIVVYEKINTLSNFNNRYAIYEKSAIENYRNTHWLYEIEVLTQIKHKAVDYEDDLDAFLEAKRRKIELDSMEYLMLEDKDTTIVEENIKTANESILKYNNCQDAVKQLEEQIDLERKKSVELENLLRSAL